MASSVEAAGAYPPVTLDGPEGFEGAKTTWDQLTPTWRVLQLKQGHRFSNDDKLAAWRGSEHRPDATRLVDLGSGIGSVGLSALWRMPPTSTLLMVEAQAVSCCLARRTVEANGLQDRCRLIEADIRDLDDVGDFDLVTGSPPYFPVAECVVSENSQRAHCRLEMRGGLEAYCEAAARLLSPEGRFAFVMASADPRVEEAPVAHGLVVVERFDYAFKHGRQPHICTVVCARKDEPSLTERVDRVLTLRDAEGVRTLEYRAIQEYLALPPRAASLEALGAALQALREASTEVELRVAVEAAVGLGMRPTKGSEELFGATTRLATMTKG